MTIQGYPLSPQQEHLFRLVAEAGSPPYRSSASVVIEGGLDVEVLRLAANDLVSCYEILRTEFEQPRGLEAPIQVVREPGGLPPSWSVVDRTCLRGVRNSELPERAERPEPSFGDAPRDSRDGEAYGLSLALERLEPGLDRLVISVPALCADRVGVARLAAVLEKAYLARLCGERLDEEPMQGADLAAWLRDLLEAEGAEVGLDYWRRQDLTALLHFRLPLEKSAGRDRPFRPRRLEQPFDAGLWNAAREVAAGASRREADGGDVDAADVLLAAWTVLLGRLSEQDLVVVGILGEGRHYEGLEEVVAPMARFLPLLVEVSPATRFLELLQSIASARSEAEEWQEYFTWEPWRRALRHVEGTFFLPALFEHRSLPGKLAEGPPGWRIEREESLGDRFRVRLTGREAPGGGLTLALDYDASSLDETSATLLLERLDALLAAVIQTPGAVLDQLEVLSPGERRQLLAEAVAVPEGRAGDGTEDGDPLAGFRRWAAEDPGRPAVRGGGEPLSYGDLAAAVDRWAHRLRELGVGPDVRVGLAAGRSPRTVAVVLAVIEAGGAFVSLDPTYPADRLRFMLGDAGVSLLIAERGAFKEGSDPGAEVVWLDGGLAPEGEPSTAGAAKARGSAPSSALAYVVYTSGSTGEPRGAMITRENLASYLAALGDRLGIRPDDRYLHTASISFSSAVRQLFLPLAHGAEIVLADDDERRDPLALMARAADSGVTVFDLVPSHWRACVFALSSLEAPRRLEILPEGAPRLVVSASEPLASDLPRDWRHRLGHRAKMVNMFGQTETTGIVATFDLEPPPADARVTGVPVGRAIAGTRLLVLDRRLRPAPLGVTGRVFVAGAGVGRGYLGRPAATAERFVPDRYSSTGDRRLYDSGDIGRLRPDGVLELLGRADQQVKIRGLRVELGEIEVALTDHPSVREGVVTTHAGDGREARLVAYVVPVEAPGPSADGLRTYLQERLPGYMVPAFFVTLDELPLAATGKVDRRALPAPIVTGGAAAEYVAPRDPIEEKLAEIWSRLLGVERVGVHDNFFRLGGHSLLGTVLMTRLREAFAVDLPVVRLFEAPTVAGLAAVIAPLAGDPAGEEQIPRLERAPGAEEVAVEEMSDDQVDALLEEMLAREAGGADDA